MRIEQSTLGLGDPAQLLIIKASGVHILHFILFYFFLRAVGSSHSKCCRDRVGVCIL